MANKKLFGSGVGAPARPTDTRNQAGAPAYKFGARHALAQLACTGTVNDTYYASGQTQLEEILMLAKACEPEFVAQTAIWARENGLMKDVPAILLAHLASEGKGNVRAKAALEAAFPKVIDNAKMLRNFVQIIRSGVTGRKSLGSQPKRLVRGWIHGRTPEYLFRNSTGNSPSLADILKMVHPRPANEAFRALFGYLVGKKADPAHLPAPVVAYEDFKLRLKANEPAELPEGVPPEMVLGLDGLSPAHWRSLLERANWHFLRMNLNTFRRHGLLEDAETITLAANKLAAPEAIQNSRVMPYQLLTTYHNADLDARKHRKILEALEMAVEVASRSVPEVPGDVIVAVDVSGSMGSPVTGFRVGATSKTRCVDVAALMAASIIRRNPTAGIVRFDERASWFRANKDETILSMANRLAANGGGTNVSSVMELLLTERTKVSCLIIVSDNMSWMEYHQGGTHGATPTALLWRRIAKANPGAKLVLHDIQPYTNSQMPEAPDVLNIGGFSDNVFEVISRFVQGRLNPEHWVDEISKIQI